MKKETWNGYDMMRFCMRHNLYTGGDSQHYEMMLDFVNRSEPTEANLKLVAMDIAFHSYDEDGMPFNVYDMYFDPSYIIDYILEEVVK